MTLTPMERKVLLAIARSEYQHGTGEDLIGTYVYSKGIADNAGISRRSAAGVFSSLSKKGLVTTGFHDEDVVALTAAGAQALPPKIEERVKERAMTPRQIQDFKNGFAEGYREGKHGETSVDGRPASPEAADGIRLGLLAGARYKPGDNSAKTIEDAVAAWAGGGHRVRESGGNAESAGEQYATDQIQSDHFMNWVLEQLLEASKMDPSQVLPLKTKSDAKMIARNMLQQLEWDTRRELQGDEIERLIGAERVTRDDITEFYKGFRKALDGSRDWLADELLQINEGLRGGGSVEEARGAVVRESASGGAHEFNVVRKGWGAPKIVGTFRSRAEAERESDELNRQALKDFKEGRTTYDVPEFIVEAAGASVDDPFYVIQGLYNGPEAYIAGASFGFDDEPTAIAEAKKLSKSPYFEGDYVRIITRDGELVWDSRSGGTRETTRRPKAQRRRR